MPTHPDSTVYRETAQLPGEFSPWTDNLSPWLSFGALATTRHFTSYELLWMCLPLFFSLAIQLRHKWNLAPYRLNIEIGTLCLVVVMAALKMSLVSITINVLFMLCAIRLSMPRTLPQQRQIFLMAFLLFLVTCVHTPGMAFMAWIVLWVPLAIFLFARQNWDATREKMGLAFNMRKSAIRSLFGWTLSIVAVGGVCFVILPRHHTHLGSRWGTPQGGLTDRIDLSERGPIVSSGERILRIVPQKGDRLLLSESLLLLRGYALENYQHGAWCIRHSLHPDRYPSRRQGKSPALDPFDLSVTLHLEPGSDRILPRPYVDFKAQPANATLVDDGPGDSLLWSSLNPQGAAVQMDFKLPGEAGFSFPASARLRLPPLTDKTSPALARWLTKVAPEPLPTPQLVRRLERALNSFSYTLENPSGKANDPLGDFLEKSRAGHCEYFASAMALALRQKGVQARVITGFRLGPWIETGGYWLVTQDEAHSWVEYLDEAAGLWRVSDPTPGLPVGRYGQSTLWASWQCFADAMRFKWEHLILRFSPNQQLALWSWLQTRISHIALPTHAIKTWWRLLLLPLLFALGRAWWQQRKQRLAATLLLPDLQPLLRVTQRDFPVQPGDTLSRWCARVADAKPHMASAWHRLAEMGNQAAYGEGTPPSLKALVKEMKRAYRKPQTIMNVPTSTQ